MRQHAIPTLIGAKARVACLMLCAHHRVLGIRCVMDVWLANDTAARATTAKKAQAQPPGMHTQGEFARAHAGCAAPRAPPSSAPLSSHKTVPQSTQNCAAGIGHCIPRLLRSRCGLISSLVRSTLSLGSEGASQLFWHANGTVDGRQRSKHLRVFLLQPLALQQQVLVDVICVARPSPLASA